jgi:hypothetical protein
MRNDQVEVGTKVNFTEVFGQHTGIVIALGEPGIKAADRSVEIGEIQPPIPSKTSIHRICGQLTAAPLGETRGPQRAIRSYVENR